MSDIEEVSKKIQVF